jgi:hypothetical protein
VAKPQENGLYGMPFSVKSYKMTYPMWEYEFLISASIMVLSEVKPNIKFGVEVLENKLLIDNYTESHISYIYLKYAYIKDGIYYYADKFHQDEIKELTQIKRKHKIENILE